MIADGRETALIPFMLRPFRCTDTRGRQAVFVCVCVCVYARAVCERVCVWGIGALSPHAHKCDPPSHLWEEPPYHSVWLCVCVCVCMCVWEDQNASSVHIPPPSIKARPLGHPPYSLQLIWKTSSHFFKVYAFHIISAFPQMWKQLWKLLHLYLFEGGTYHWI